MNNIFILKPSPSAKEIKNVIDKKLKSLHSLLMMLMAGEKDKYKNNSLWVAEDTVYEIMKLRKQEYHE